MLYIYIYIYISDNIEANIDTTAVRAGDATLELQSADRYQRRARNRMCCLLMTFTIVLLVIVLVVVLTHK
jgi:syntaxin 7